MLLIIEALLLIPAALGRGDRTAVEGQIFPLGMAVNSVDDRYVGCKTNMADQVKTQLLEKELNNSPEFKDIWQIGEPNAKIPNDNLTRHHSVALYVYTSRHLDLYQDFNKAVRRNKQKYIDRTFTWYSLFFLLTDAIQILNKTQNGCKLTYRGTEFEFDKKVEGKKVRFGSFTSSSLDRTQAKRYGKNSCFEIRTCEGADVSEYSALPHEEEVLIPPYETFRVTAVRTRTDHEDLWCETVYTLESSGVRSDLNCALCKNPAVLRKTLAFNRNAFCKCFHPFVRRLYTKHWDQSMSFLRRLTRCVVHHQMQRGDYPGDREFNSEMNRVFYLLKRNRDRKIHSGLQKDSKRLCYQLLQPPQVNCKTPNLLRKKEGRGTMFLGEQNL